MTASYLVIYEGEPEDPAAFFDYYVTQHVPLVWGFPEIRGVEIMRGAEDSDLFMITRLVFDSLDDLHEAVTSPHRRITKADMGNFPPFAGTVRWEVVENIEFERPKP